MKAVELKGAPAWDVGLTQEKHRKHWLFVDFSLDLLSNFHQYWRMKPRGKYGQGMVYQPKFKAADGTRKTIDRWYIRFYDQTGKQVTETTQAKTEREARTILNSRLHQVQQGTAPVSAKNLSYDDLRRTILLHYSTNKLRSLEVKSDGSQNLKGLAKLDEFFGWSPTSKGWKVSAITNVAWTRFIEQRRREGVSDATIRNSGACLRQMFTVASSAEYKLISPAQVPTFTMPRQPKPRKDFATKEEFDRLLAALPAKYRPFAIWLFYAATRKNEAISITWSQVDIINAMYFPDETINKTGDSTPRPLADEIIEALKTIGPRNPDDKVFLHTAKGFKKAFRKVCLQTSLGKIAWKCGQCASVIDGPEPKPNDPAIVCENCKTRSKGARIIPMQWMYHGLSIHGLRRSSIVFFRECGFSDSEIMAISGHKSAEVFLGYSATRVEQMRKRLSTATANRDRLQNLQKQLEAK